MIRELCKSKSKSVPAAQEHRERDAQHQKRAERDRDRDREPVARELYFNKEDEQASQALVHHRYLLPFYRGLSVRTGSCEFNVWTSFEQRERPAGLPIPPCEAQSKSRRRAMLCA